ncbi:MAG: hypothetical protein K1000chlam2_01213 [Chlamydiae bacterium]|nr:hypothetical protein [Chlamydiota bacterium]
MESIDRTLKESLVLIQKHKGPMSLRTLLKFLAKKGPILVILILILPFCQPFHIPVLSTFFGLAIALVAFQIVFGQPFWLPKFLLSKKISTSVLKKVLRKSLVVIEKLKRWIHPRWTWLCKSAVMKVLNGLVIALLALFLALPLPIPTTNLGVAWPILLICLGLLENDGLFVFLGYFVGIVYFVFFITLVIGLGSL